MGIERSDRQHQPIDDTQSRFTVYVTGLLLLWDQAVSWLGLTAFSRVQMRTWAMNLCSVNLTLSTCIQTMLVPLVLPFMAQTRAWRLTSCRSL